MSRRKSPATLDELPDNTPPSVPEKSGTAVSGLKPPDSRTVLDRTGSKYNVVPENEHYQAPLNMNRYMA